MDVSEKKRGKQSAESKSGASASSRQQQRSGNPADPSGLGQIFQFKLVLLGKWFHEVLAILMHWGDSVS